MAERGEFELPVPICEQSDVAPCVVDLFPRGAPNGVSQKNTEPRSEQTSIHCLLLQSDQFIILVRRPGNFPAISRINRVSRIVAGSLRPSRPTVR